MRLRASIWSGNIRWDFISFGPGRVREAGFDSEGGGRGATEKFCLESEGSKNYFERRVQVLLSRTSDLEASLTHGTIFSRSVAT